MSSVFFFKQKTAYEMRISDWSSDVCSSDLSPPDTSTGRCRTIRAPWHHAHDAPARHAADRPSHRQTHRRAAAATPVERKSVVEGKSVSVRVDLGGRRSI